MKWPLSQADLLGAPSPIGDEPLGSRYGYSLRSEHAAAAATLVAIFVDQLPDWPDSDDEPGIEIAKRAVAHAVSRIVWSLQDIEDDWGNNNPYA